MFSEDEFIQINAIQHYVFCPRQCALIMVEDIWQENLFTVRGQLLHQKVDSSRYESRGAVKTVYGLYIQSRRLGLSGRCDVVEFRRSPGGKGEEQVVPVEFKAGQPKQDISDKAQLCAQALCLEEMLNLPVRKGAFFYGRIRSRVEVEIDDTLRRRTEEIIQAVHRLVKQQKVPTIADLQRHFSMTASQLQRRCRNCSLHDACQPGAQNERKLTTYLKRLYEP